MVSTDKHKNVSYDARQETTRILVERLERGKEALLFGDYRSSYNNYRGVFNFVRAYIKPSYKEEIETALEELRLLIQTTMPLLRSNEDWSKQAGLKRAYRIEDKLMTVEGLLCEYARHMLLPSSDSDEDATDFDDMLKQMEERTGV